ncbi:MAG TPA: hypothetical protein VG368_05840, partial [Acidimicrobiales bacterium]|nr:hypothetical protein [Acidimicrobiales bacterium]
PDRPGPQGLLSRYVDLVASHEELIRVLSRDPSVGQRPPAKAAAPLFERLTQLLSGEPAPDVVSRAVVRAALGGVNGVLIFANPTENRDVLREVALTSACRVLEVLRPSEQRR